MCKATGCSDHHRNHYCDQCGDIDSDHRARNCPKLHLKKCKASGCSKNHSNHFCDRCGNPNSDHRARNCNSLVGTLPPQLRSGFISGHVGPLPPQNRSGFIPSHGLVGPLLHHIRSGFIPGHGQVGPLPLCQYGEKCTRLNNEHRKKYHPSTHVPAPKSGAGGGGDSGRGGGGGGSGRGGGGASHTDPYKPPRIQIMNATISHLSTGVRQAYHDQARRNIAHWSSRIMAAHNRDLILRVVSGDWGVVTGDLTREFGKTFAVLNMANAYTFGGGYLKGCAAQEENMFRRTDCHFANDGVGSDGKYSHAMSSLLNAERGLVYIDMNPRVCFRGPEDVALPGFGYEQLHHHFIFPFYELRAAAKDLRGGKTFNYTKCLERVIAQFETLRQNGIRHVVFSAFGCGAFENPAPEVARAYRDALTRYRQYFDVIVFAIFYPGYGPRGNFDAFNNEFRGF